MALLNRTALPFPRPFPRPRGGFIAPLAAAALVVMLAMALVHQFSRLTSTGYEIDELERIRAGMQAENRDVEAEVAMLSSLARVELEARLEMGMVPATNQMHIRVSQPLPEERTLPTRYLPPARKQTIETPARGGSFWDAIRDLVPF
jgi:cell division protein FtsL